MIKNSYKSREQMSLLARQLAQFESQCQGMLGVYAVHLRSGKMIEHNAAQSFLLCSTYKIPMAVFLLQKVQRGEINLNQICEIKESDLRPGMVSTLNQLQYKTAVPMSVLNLLQFMLQESCNTATDIILRLIGGPMAVMKSLNAAGINNLRVDRSTLEAISVWDGITDLVVDESFSLQYYKTLEKQASTEASLLAKKKFKTDVRDHGTPKAMGELLLKIVRHEILDKEYAQLLLNIMRRCKTGAQRIMGMLPVGTAVAHKTGSLTGYTNDVGVISLPHEQGGVVVAIFIQNSPKLVNHDERIIAEVARTIYDYFLFLQ